MTKIFEHLQTEFNISTHTLTWSVTDTIIYICDFAKISTHTLTWSVTHNIALIGVPSDISTHTLTWSVTISSTLLSGICSFQLTRSRGAWLVTSLSPLDLQYFNSHAHVERDFIHCFIPPQSLNFNSHAHVERDVSVSQHRSKASQFQLTRSRGAWHATTMMYN